MKKMICKIADCKWMARSRGLCRKHLVEWRVANPSAPHPNTKHGHRRRGGNESPEHRSWTSMMTRCRNPRRDDFKHYGGRGITVCPEWYQFENFLRDMGLKPSRQHTLERVDNDRGYEPSNCRWATRAEQSRNCRSNLLITIKERTQHLEAWSRESGVKAVTISRRIKTGWNVREAVFKPADKRFGQNQKLKAVIETRE